MTMLAQTVTQKRIAEAPDSCQGIMRRAYAGEASPREAIRAQCLICVGYQRAEITACTGYSCPLWSYRPYQSTREDDKTAPQGAISGPDMPTYSPGAAGALEAA